MRALSLCSLFLLCFAKASFAATLTVNTLADELDVPSGPSLSLREAVRDAATGDTIVFAPELDGCTILLSRGMISSFKGLTIDALSLPAGITLDGLQKGAIFSLSSPTLRGLNMIRGLGQGASGQVIKLSGKTIIEHCSISSSLLKNSGRVMSHDGGTLTLRQTSITGTRSRPPSFSGSIIFSSASQATLVNCTIASNQSDGSCINFLGGELELIHSTLTGNRFSTGDAIFFVGSTLKLQNSVLDNLPSNLRIARGNLQKSGANFLSSNANVSALFPAGPLIGTPSNPRDPVLSALGLHGGRTPCRVPVAGSPLLNAGVTGTNTPATDQRGQQRTEGSAPDLGAAEAGIEEFHPVDGAVGTEIQPTLWWSDTHPAPPYNVYLGTSPTSLFLLETAGIGRCPAPRLLPGTTYYWRVVSSTTTSPIRSFTTRPAIMVTTTLDTTTATEGLSLRAAVQLANATPGSDTIRFQSDLAGQVHNFGSSEIEFTEETIVEGTSLAGGASFRGGSFRIESPVQLDSVTLEDGSSNGFGTIHVASDFVARNCTITGGRANYGAGIYLSSGSCRLIHCTVTGNKANIAGGGIYRAGGTLTLQNSIVAGNESLETAPDIRSTVEVIHLGENLIGSNDGNLFPAGELVGTAENPIDPVIAPLGNWGPTGAWHCPPLPGSPAMGKALTSSTTPAVDLLGQPRPETGNATLGAVEYIPSTSVISPANGATDSLIQPRLSWSMPGDQFEIFLGNSPSTLPSIGTTTRGVFQLSDLAENTTYYWRIDSMSGDTVTPGTVFSFTTRGTIVVTTLVDEMDASPDDGAGLSLREAVGIANERPGMDRIEFHSSLSGGTILLKEPKILSIYSECLIDASDLASNITLNLRGSAPTSLGIFTEEGSDVTLRGLNITGAFNNAFQTAIRSLGAIALQDLSMHGNIGRDGPAVSAEGRFIAERCSFYNNRAEGGSGGALELEGGIARIINCSLIDNFATADGGAIRSFSKLELIHCTISGNSAGDGGGVYSSIPNTLLQNCIIASNESTRDPAWGDIKAEPSSLSVRGKNLIGINTGVETLFPTGPLAGTVASPLDPRLSQSGSHGGAIYGKLPLPGSPAIDAAEAVTGNPIIDQRCLTRTFGDSPDLGAMEVFPVGLAILDSDGDGMDDRLEAIHGLSVGIDDSLADEDGDGSSNLDELLNFTNPRDGSDFLRVLGLEPMTNTESGPVMRVTWKSHPGLRYTAEMSSDLDWESENVRELDAGIADDLSKSIDIPLRPGKDFIRIRRD